MKKNKAVQPDQKKEGVFKELANLLQTAGYQVRREALKRGPGWKVMSGSCRVDGNRIIFVDRRLSQDEQISFLRGKAQGMGLASHEGSCHDSAAPGAAAQEEASPQ